MAVAVKVAVTRNCGTELSNFLLKRMVQCILKEIMKELLKLIDFGQSNNSYHG